VKLGTFLPLIILAVLFYVLVLRPSQRRQRQAAEVASSLQVGTEIMTTGGMFATVHAVTDSHVELEVAPGVVVRFVKGAVGRVISPETLEPPDSSSGDEAPTNSTET
jgi:preprotein translocase subunit YajC